MQTSPITGVSATQAAADSGGTWTDLEIGHSIYKFKTVLPGGYDQSRRRTRSRSTPRANTDDIIGKNYYANVEHDFRPDGEPVTETWDKTTNGACNACHNPLSAHGGSRQDVKLCVTCHSPQTVDPDTGNTVDFKVMVHKIHLRLGPAERRGRDALRHHRQQPVGPRLLGRRVPAGHPQLRRRCHTPRRRRRSHASGTPTRPAPACGSCHDNVDFVTGANHPAGPAGGRRRLRVLPPAAGRPRIRRLGHRRPHGALQVDAAEGPRTPRSSPSPNAAPGQHPTVIFRITENDGTPCLRPPSRRDSGSSNLNILMGGPTADYAINPFRERADGATSRRQRARFTFTHCRFPPTRRAPGPSRSRRAATWPSTFPPPGDDTIREAAFNPVHYENLAGGTADPRRMVVDIAKCNTCHGQLAFHGGQRLNPQECVMCHNPNFTSGDDAVGSRSTSSG